MREDARTALMLPLLCALDRLLSAEERFAQSNANESNGRSREHRTEVAKEVAQIAIKAFLRMVGLANAPLRLLVSEVNPKR